MRSYQCQFHPWRGCGPRPTGRLSAPRSPPEHFLQYRLRNEGARRCHEAAIGGRPLHLRCAGGHCA
eukprot:1829477-Pyramimonas_sp.AAC.1